MKLVWFPAWLCQNYTFGKSYGSKCPYCPYSLSKETNRLIYNDKETSSDERADASDLIGFFCENYESMGRHLEVSGGEALMRKDLAFILAAIPHSWAITSNTLMDASVESIIRTGAISRCISWTASWHPFSGQELKFARNIESLVMAGAKVRATTVVSRHTVENLRRTLNYLQSLPLNGMNWHLDAHGSNALELAELKARADSVLGEGVAYVAGQPPRGVNCNRHGKLMAVSPDGTLYQCVTFAYQDKFPIIRVDARVLLDSLPERIEWCDEECFACCDHVKHVRN